MDSTGSLTRAVTRFVGRYLGDRPDSGEVCVGLSGGADSLALTVASVRAGLSVTALIVDHGLQHNSQAVASAAAAAAASLGARPRVLPVTVGTEGGLEAAARTARYAALDAARDGHPVLLAHTMDDQAETVLLGLARGSGTRSLSGMREWRAPWGRPLLGVRRSDTEEVCAENGLEPYLDPHNQDPRFTRVRLRVKVLPLLDDVLQGGVVGALARTADALAADNDALDAFAEECYAASKSGSGTIDLAVDGLRAEPSAIRTRVIRLWLRDVGATEPASRVIAAVDDLLNSASAGAQVAIGGTAGHRLSVVRVDGRLTVSSSPR